MRRRYDASQTAGMDAMAIGGSFEEAEAAERTRQLDWVTAPPDTAGSRETWPRKAAQEPW